MALMAEAEIVEVEVRLGNGDDIAEWQMARAWF